VVMVAGGDGTVRKAAGFLLDRGVPIALVPLGTANNISKALGLSDSWRHTIERLDTAERRRFDAGMARGAWGETHFVEAAGLGLFPVTMCLAENRKDNREQRARHEDRGLTRDLRYLSHVLDRLKPRAWQIEADGADLSGEYIICEVMNIRSLGPNLVLAPQADPGDGFFDLVLVSENERPRVADYLASRISGREAEVFLPTRRVRRVMVHASGAEVHVDDRLERPHEKPSAMGGLVDLTVREGALEFLVA